MSLILISAADANGGGYVHRLFDGHPAFYSYPFELLVGTGQVPDGLSDRIAAKYRWARFAGAIDRLPANAIFDAFLDVEIKTYLADATTSKHGFLPLDLRLEEWRACFLQRLPEKPSRAQAIQAYVRALFESWHGRASSGREAAYLGHCPCIVLDTDQVLADFPDARIVHVVRSPFNAFADMYRRIPDLDIERFAHKWTLVNGVASFFRDRFPDNVMLVRLTDILDDSDQALISVCRWLGVEFDEILRRPTWNRTPLDEMGPFGGVPEVSLDRESRLRDTVDPAHGRIIARETFAVRARLGLTDAWDTA